jgi:hypothetical protein
MNDSKAIDQSAEFQRRRGSWFQVALISGLAFAAGAVLVTLFPEILRWVAQVLICAGLAGLCASPLIANYRCPRCDKIPRGDEIVAFDPAVCRHCRARLK